MRAKVMVSVAIAATLFSATVRLPAAPCILTNTPGEEACEPGCCANKSCCATSHKRTGAPVQPLAKSSSDQQTIVAPAIRAVLPLAAPIVAEAKIVFIADQAATSPSRLALLCTFLI